jgi:hypothetical protein
VGTTASALVDAGRPRHLVDRRCVRARGHPTDCCGESDVGSVRMLLIVDEPESVMARATAAGATQVYPVGEEHGWGRHSSRVVVLGALDGWSNRSGSPKSQGTRLMVSNDDKLIRSP